MEAMISGYVYFKTNKTSAIDALEEFKSRCEEAGINADNMDSIELRDDDGNTIDEF